MLPPSLFVLGIVLLIISVLIGESGFGWIVVFPVFFKTGLLALAGVVCILLSFFVGLLSFGSLPRSVEKLPGSKTPPPKSGFGGVVLLGPIPIIFGSDARMAKVALIAALVAVVVIVVLVLLILLGMIHVLTP